MTLFPETATADAKRLVCAKGLRAVGDGYVSILLPAYLLALGNSPFEVGVLTTATLLGSAGLTLLTGLTITRFGHRRALLAASALMILTGLGFAAVQAFWPLLLIAFVGTLNPSSGDVSVFLPMEQSLLTRSVADKDRTDLFARYSLAGALMGAFGTLLAAVPERRRGRARHHASSTRCRPCSWSTPPSASPRGCCIAGFPMSREACRERRTRRSGPRAPSSIA